MNVIKRIFTKLVYPDGLCCLLCSAELSQDSPYGFCKKCAPKKITHCCDLCGASLHNGLQKYCDSCLKYNTWYFSAARAPFVYSDENIKKIVWQIKYGNKPYVAKYMASAMADVVRLADWGFDLIAFVPLHKKRERKRGYNQAKVIAEHLGELFGKPVITALEKITYSEKSATKLGREDRIKSLQGSFALTENDIKGKTLLLVDDVATTHATANECAKMLRLGKARKVYLITYATGRGDRPF